MSARLGRSCRARLVTPAGVSSATSCGRASDGSGSPARVRRRSHTIQPATTGAAAPATNTPYTTATSTWLTFGYSTLHCPWARVTTKRPPKPGPPGRPVSAAVVAPAAQASHVSTITPHAAPSKTNGVSGIVPALDRGWTGCCDMLIAHRPLWSTGVGRGSGVDGDW